MSEMIERVAAAIYLARNGRGAIAWSRRDASHKAPYLLDARAAIEAMQTGECICPKCGIRHGLAEKYGGPAF